MKTTSNLFYILKSELINAGHDEFVNNHQLTFYDKDQSFIHKIMNYDSDVKSIVNDIVFQNVRLNNSNSDDQFKREFVNKFLYREIAFQTLELFSSQVVHYLLVNIDYINTLYDGLDDYIQGKSNTTSSDQAGGTVDNRYLSSSLPQSEVNLNVENTQLDYGDTNTISKTKDTKTGNSESESKQYNLDNFIKTRSLKEELFIIFDQKCFMQIW